ncbi:MAG: HPr family phosphocarrier protein [Isosphaeraceae bacterium]|nr:HPr family phosphocarrier protein [Isosphaeraceae bacterium]
MVLIRRQIEIVNALGLHLRAADKFVHEAQQHQAEVRVSLDGRAVNGKSIRGLTTLAAECGTRIDLEADGPDAEEAIAALCGLIEARFDENDGQDNPPTP